MNRYIKHNSPKKRNYGSATKHCRRCGNAHAHVNKYGLHLCRRCFREMASKIGFKKYR